MISRFLSIGILLASFSLTSCTSMRSYQAGVDDTNDESIEQRSEGVDAVTVAAHNESSGNTYDLDADVNGNEVERLYFPNGGSVGFSCSEIDSDGNGSGTDEQGREWSFEGIEGGNSIASSEDSSMDE